MSASPARLLLDTHALIWWWLDDPMLPDGMRDCLGDRGRQIYVSAVTPLEIAIKLRHGQLLALRPLMEDYAESLAADGFLPLAIHAGHAYRGGLLPGDHRDPFDRLLAAQGLIEELTIVTRDREMRDFGCEVIW